ncbi:CLUMA_CG017092, isoform A [Clunio marinus]|uniref:CLUMA_CG017092, isoform A n=1 Tax=Clunio marinus TaxID=568069 RepID=A0A1J1IUN6_9DIPT|nr:CLUMA_CG017092, isoform A [Clunio marinus]
MELFTIVLKFIFLLILFKFISSQEEQETYIRGYHCKFSDDFVFPNYSCYAKSCNRSFTTENLFFTLKKPHYKIFVNGSLMYKYGTIYREVLHFENIEICKVIEEGTSNMLFLNMTNVSTKKKTPASRVFPSGDYKTVLSFSNERKKWIATSVSTSRVTSPLKDSFGLQLASRNFICILIR